jgi:hypothetical protein
MKKTLMTLMTVALTCLFVSAAAFADNVAVATQISFTDPGGSINSSSNFSFIGTKTITFKVAGKTCNLNGSARGSVPSGCNYLLTVAPDGSISGVLTSGNSVCTQTAQIGPSCR